jgi:hypothetical protein
MADTRISSSASSGEGSTRVHVDPATLEGDGSRRHPLVVIGLKGPTHGPGAIIAGTGLEPGMPFYIDDDSLAQPAQNNGTLQQATVSGVVIDLIQVDATIVEYAIAAVLISLTTAIFAERTGNPDGLIPGQTYYVGSTPGSLTTTPPASGYSTKVGVATAANILVVAIGAPVQTVLQAEHFTVNAGASQAITPNIPVTFANAGSGGGTGALTLANGLTDGFQKTIHVVNSGEEDFTLTPAAFGDGTKITFTGGADASGSAILQWDAKTDLWWFVAGYQATIS